MRILGSHYNMKQKEREKKLFNGTYRKLKAPGNGTIQWDASVDPTLLFPLSPESLILILRWSFPLRQHNSDARRELKKRQSVSTSTCPSPVGAFYWAFPMRIQRGMEPE